MLTAAALPPYAAPPVQRHNAPLASTADVNCSSCGGGGNGRKHAERLLSSLHSAFGREDPAAVADRAVRKFLASSSKAAALCTLSYLLSDVNSPSPSSHHLALPMYRRITRAPWFGWNPKIAAGVVSLLEKLGSFDEAEALISEAVSALKPRELAAFYCDLIESYAQHGLKEKVFETRTRLQALHSPMDKEAYESMIKALCRVASPREAEEMMKEMGTSGLKPSPFHYRIVLESYGRLGLLDEMKRVMGAMVASGCELDTVCANVVLSCYGDFGELAEMATWLGQMRVSGVPLSTRTYNSVLNACPRLCSMVRNPQVLPFSLQGLVEELEEGGWAPVEALLVQELVGSRVLEQMLQWTPTEGKLDLHGCHLNSALVIMLQWVDVLKSRLLGGGREGKDAPLAISLVCGSGKHSSITGESPVKRLVSEMMFRMGSPLRIDRKNVGRLSARGTAVREWLMKMEEW